MSELSVGFIRGSLIYLMIGITFGAIMAFPGGYGWLTAVGLGNPSLAHAHSMLLGFMTMMVIGVAYHILPRFTGNPIRRPWIANANFWCSQIGTAGMVTGFFFRGYLPWLLPVAATLQAAGFVFFFVNMWSIVRPLQRLKV